MATSSVGTLADIPANTCDRVRCAIEISVSATSCEFNPTITLDPPKTFTMGNIGKRRMVWRFADPSKFEFCPHRGDGIYLQSLQRDNFERLRATDSEQGDDDIVPEGECRKRFRMINWNGDNFEYRYFIQFSDKAGRTCKVDPWIKNGR